MGEDVVLQRKPGVIHCLSYFSQAINHHSCIWKCKASFAKTTGGSLRSSSVLYAIHAKEHDIFDLDVYHWKTNLEVAKWISCLCEMIQLLKSRGLSVCVLVRPKHERKNLLGWGWARIPQKLDSSSLSSTSLLVSSLKNTGAKTNDKKEINKSLWNAALLQGPIEFIFGDRMLAQEAGLFKKMLVSHTICLYTFFALAFRLLTANYLALGIPRNWSVMRRGFVAETRYSALDRHRIECAFLNLSCRTLLVLSSRLSPADFFRSSLLLTECGLLTLDSDLVLSVSSSRLRRLWRRSSSARLWRSSCFLWRTFKTSLW